MRRWLVITFILLSLPAYSWQIKPEPNHYARTVSVKEMLKVRERKLFKLLIIPILNEDTIFSGFEFRIEINGELSE